MASGQDKPFGVQATDEDIATSAFAPSGQCLRANTDVQTARGEIYTSHGEQIRASLVDVTMPSLTQGVSMPTTDTAASLQSGLPVHHHSEDELSSSRFDALERENRIPPQVTNILTPDISPMRQDVSTSTLGEGYCSWTGQSFPSSINSNQLYGLGEGSLDGRHIPSFDPSRQFFGPAITASRGLESSVPHSRGIPPLLPEPASNIPRTYIPRQSTPAIRNNTQPSFAVNSPTRGDPCTQNKTLQDRNHEQRQSIGQVTIVTDVHRQRFDIHQQIKRPDLAKFEARLQTFQNTTSSWQNTAPLFLQQLANAGFYSTEGSYVKCFACDNELGDWDDKDDPFYEHSYWFGSDCAFVQAVMQKPRNMNGERSRVSRNTSTVDTPRGTGCTGSSQEQFHSSEQLNTYNTQLREMGFSPDSVRLIIQRREREHGCESLNIDGLIEDLINMNQHEPAKDPVHCYMCKKEMLTGYTLCPCGHLCVCDACSKRVNICPVCKGKITDRIKTFTKV